MLPRVYGERAHLEVIGGLKVETVKDFAPQWLADRLRAPVPEPALAAITAGDEDEDTIH